MAKIRCSNLEKEVQIIKAATVLWNTVAVMMFYMDFCFSRVVY